MEASGCHLQHHPVCTRPHAWGQVAAAAATAALQKAARGSTHELQLAQCSWLTSAAWLAGWCDTRVHQTGLGSTATVTVMCTEGSGAMGCGMARACCGYRMVCCPPSRSSLPPSRSSHCASPPRGLHHRGDLYCALVTTTIWAPVALILAARNSGDRYSGLFKADRYDGVGDYFFAGTGTTVRSGWRAGQQNGTGRYLLGSRTADGPTQHTGRATSASSSSSIAPGFGDKFGDVIGDFQHGKAVTMRRGDAPTGLEPYHYKRWAFCPGRSSDGHL